MTEKSADKIRATVELESERETNLRGNTTIQTATWFNEDTTDDVMSLDPETHTENGTIEIDIGGTVRQIPFYDK